MVSSHPTSPELGIIPQFDEYVAAQWLAHECAYQTEFRNSCWPKWLEKVALDAKQYEALFDDFTLLKGTIEQLEQANDANNQRIKDLLEKLAANESKLALVEMEKQAMKESIDDMSCQSYCRRCNGPMFGL